ncbi:MAG TPA: hypothetical protein V6C86_00815 [Oculatellaceae cyanobacterium]|jgi:Domain of unknown function (DUF4034)
MKSHNAFTVNLMSALLLTQFCATKSCASKESEEYEKFGVKGVSTLGWNVHHGDPQEEAQEKVLNKTVPDLMAKHEYAKLDSLAESLRPKRPYARGTTPLGQFYDALELQDSALEDDWPVRLNDLTQWWKQNPNSKTAPAALVQFWAAYAWKARGTGFSDTVTPEGWKLFSERLDKGANVLEQAKAKPDVCSMLYAFGQRIALGQSWDKQKYDQLTNEAVQKFPDRNIYYFNKIYYLQPRWHGGPNEWVDFAEKISNQTGGTNGDKLYAKLVWRILGQGLYENILTEFPTIKWARIDKGLQALQKDYPDSVSVPSVRLRFAILAGQKALAKQILNKLGNNIDIHTWRKKNYFFKTRKELLGN